jgi:tRNA(adenine34) deaminase
MSQSDEYWMQRALACAEKAAAAGEVPVGAIIVLNDEIIAEAYNQPIALHDPTAHAEIQALRMAANKISNYRLLNTTLYVTLEPCVMCFGAMVHARINRLVYAASDPKTGVIDTAAKLLEQPFINHRFTVTAGVLSQDSSALLRDFFKARR